MHFTSLHHHTTYSNLDGFQMPAIHANRIAELNGWALACTEHGNVGSHSRLERACAGEKDPISQEPSRAGGIKPLFGCEIYMPTGRRWWADNKTQRKYHLTVLAKNATGYRNLLKLVSWSWTDSQSGGGFYYEPTVTFKQLVAHKEGLLIMSGCQGGLLFCSTVGGKDIEPERASYKRGLAVAQRFAQVFGDDYAVEVQAFPELSETCRFNPLAERIAHAVRRRLVATKDCHYVLPEEAEIQQVLHNVRPGNKQTLEDQVRSWGYKAALCPPTTDRSVYLSLRGTGLSRDASIEAIASTEEIAQDCSVELPKLPMLRYPLPAGWTDERKYWRHLLKLGWKFRGYHKMPASVRKKARQMLDHEIDVIEQKNFVSYFLVVRDGIVFAKDYRQPPFGQGIPVGPGRGSAAASIACYLLRITEVNPMLFPNLMFERFIDISRADYPDIDTDFASEGRYLVLEFYASKYGRECVANIGTWTYYKSKLALDDVAKVHHVPPYEVEKIKDVLVERSSGDLRASATIEDTVDQFEAAGDVVERYPELRKAMQLEGNIKQFGVHAAGLAVANGPLTDITAVVQREVKGRRLEVITLDHRDAERQGILKLDFLGLKTMDMIHHCMTQLDMSLADLYGIPLDDAKVAAGFKRNDVVGIFQFEGRAVRSVAGSMEPDNFKEVCDCTALARPGPLHNGAANEYIDIKRGQRKPVKLHPALDDITADTNFQIVYQEQILKVMDVIGNFGWTHRSYIRKIISKKLGEQEFNRQWGEFWAGASTLHERHERYADSPMDEDTAKKIWGACITAGSYAFVIAHTISYGLLSWYMQWFKQHQPPTFYASQLIYAAKQKSRGGNARAAKGEASQIVSAMDNHVEIMRDALRHGIRVKPPHPRLSDLQWKPTGPKTLRAGLANAKGCNIGVKKAEQMVAWRAARNGDGPVRRWSDYLEVPGIGQKTVDKLKEFGRGDDPFNITAIDRALAAAKKEILSGQLLDRNGKVLPMPNMNAAQVPYERGRDIDVVWVGLLYARNLRDIFESNRARTGEELKEDEVKDPHLREFMLCYGYDGEELLNLRFDRWRYPRFRGMLWKMKLAEDIVLVRGTKKGYRTAREITVSHMWVLGE